MDPVRNYLEMFEELRRRKRWSRNNTMVRFAALTLATLEPGDRGAALERTATELRRAAGWFSPLGSSLRYLMAAMILRQGLPAARVHRQVARAREGLRKRRVPRGAQRQILAALLLVLHEEGGAVPARLLDRTAEILRRWKKDHRWLTGSDDLPAAALHATGDESTETVATRVEVAYQRLRRARFWPGNPLQLVSHLMAFDPRGVDEACLRFEQVARELGKRRFRARQSRYDEVALLALSAAKPADVVATTMEYRQRLRAARPRPPAELAFSLAAGLTLAGDVSAGPRHRQARQLATLHSVLAVLASQRAAGAAAAGAAAGSG